MSSASSLRINREVQPDTLARSFQNRATLPIANPDVTPVQREGSIIYDTITMSLYYSDGTQWLQVIATPGGNLPCIQDLDGDTSVCTDTDPSTDPDTIIFRNNGSESARFTPTGVLSVGTAVPDVGKIAHFEGDIAVTGVVDPTGVQYEEQGAPPVVNTATEGLTYTNSATVGDFANTFIFVDSANVEHTLGDMVGPANSTDDAVARFDGVTGKVIQSSTMTIDDSGNAVINGDLTVTGDFETDGLLLNEQATNPFPGITATQGVFYVQDGSVGNYTNNHPQFVDGTGTEHTLGDVIGDSTSTDNAIVRYDGTTGRIIQNSVGILDDSGNISGISSIASPGTLELIPAALQSVTISGNLNVTGSTTTTSSEIVNIADSSLYMNDGYTTPIGESGSIVVNYLPTATTDTVDAPGFTASSGPSNATVQTVTGGVFSAGDIIQISDANNQTNDGLFEVDSHTVGGLLTIRGSGTVSTTQEWFQNDFVTDAVVAGTITQVNVAVFGVDSSGNFIFQEGNNTGDASITSPSSVVVSVSSGTGITVDNTDPNNPIINLNVPVDETNGGTGQSTYATGDILYSSAIDTLARLAAGANGQVLTLAGGIPSWATPDTTTLAGLGTGEDLVVDGTGPTLSIRSIAAADTSIVVTTNSNNVEIANNADINSSGGGITLINDGTPVGDYSLRSLSAGSGINITDANPIVISSTASSVSAAGALTTSDAIYAGAVQANLTDYPSLTSIAAASWARFNIFSAEVALTNTSLNVLFQNSNSSIVNNSGQTLVAQATFQCLILNSDATINLALGLTTNDLITTVGSSSYSIGGPNSTTTFSLSLTESVWADGDSFDIYYRTSGTIASMTLLGFSFSVIGRQA